MADRRTVLIAGAALIGGVLPAVSCGAPAPDGRSASRVKAYSGLADLAADSAEIVVGTVSDRRAGSADGGGRDPYLVIGLTASQVLRPLARGRA